MGKGRRRFEKELLSLNLNLNYGRRIPDMRYTSTLWNSELSKKRKTHYIKVGGSRGSE